jgi:hypothetical protein
MKEAHLEISARSTEFSRPSSRLFFTVPWVKALKCPRVRVSVPSVFYSAFRIRMIPQLAAPSASVVIPFVSGYLANDRCVKR